MTASLDLHRRLPSRRDGADRPRLAEFDAALVCVDVLPVTHDVTTFVLRHPEGAGFSFTAGQHVTVAVELDGETVERCYTIASPPTAPDTLHLTVKRTPVGRVSGLLHDTVGVGSRIRARGPYGTFSADRHRADRHLYLSAGSGITPLMSMARTRRDRGDATDVVLVHNARSPDDIIFRDELRTLGEVAGVRVVTVCEADSPVETWTGPRGRLTLPLLLDAVPDLLEREVFTCGPPPYMAAVRSLLAGAGVDPARCHEESFELGGPGPAAPGGGAPAGWAPGGSPPAGPVFAVELRRSGRTVPCEAGTSILDAAARAGVTLPSSCTQGMCGTCMCALEAGTVEMDHAGGIRPRDVARGRILPCCSTPTSDVVLDA